jgi:hypothetical protein
VIIEMVITPCSAR